jgi:hypothetical protein
LSLLLMMVMIMMMVVVVAVMVRTTQREAAVRVRVRVVTAVAASQCLTRRTWSSSTDRTTTTAACCSAASLCPAVATAAPSSVTSVPVHPVPLCRTRRCPAPAVPRCCRRPCGVARHGPRASCRAAASGTVVTQPARGTRVTRARARHASRSSPSTSPVLRDASAVLLSLLSAAASCCIDCLAAPIASDV